MFNKDNTKYLTPYLKPQQIDAMAQAALTSYEFACEWDKATQAAAEYCIEEYGFIPRRSAVLLARKQAQLKWQAIKQGVKAQIEETQR